MRKLLKTLLEIEGFSVGTYNFGNDDDATILDIESFDPDVLLMDVHLRHTDGMLLLKKIRTNNHLTNLQVLMTSGIDRKTECLQNGANDFILKPFMPDELILKLKKMTKFSRSN